jgi:hypothetical protein
MQIAHDRIFKLFLYSLAIWYSEDIFRNPVKRLWDILQMSFFIFEDKYTEIFHESSI